MPPRNRSSSSHSSSSRSSSSSSHSSSSHSYSSSHSSSHSYSSRSSGSSYTPGSFTRSTPSSHSASSHRPSSHSTSTHTAMPTGGVPIRGRFKQPTGYTRSTPGYQPPVTYHCRKHDYLYYAFGWTDTSTGTVYKPGYYDESGKYYEEVALKDKSSGILTVKCEYCDSIVKTKWAEGVQPSCPNCGAGLKMDQADELLSSYKDSSYPSGSSGSSYTQEKRKWHPILMAFMGLLLLGAIINKEPAIIFLAVAILIVTAPPVSQYLSKKAMAWSCVGIVLFSSMLTTLTPDGGSKVNIPSGEKSMYVEALGRSCGWQDDFDSYYDKETDCYFAYNAASDTWQYWYEGISSYYGEYGWMEYDEAEQQWYIEESYANWVKLPGKYETSKLWYISDEPVRAAQTEPVKLQNINSGSIYVDALGRSCEWSDEYDSYYDGETDCYFWYNTDISPASWKYWHEDISSDFGDYGWMEYDEAEKQWYIEASEGNWIVLPKGYSTDKLWYIEE